MSESVRARRSGSRFAAVTLTWPLILAGCQQLPVPRAQSEAQALAQSDRAAAVKAASPNIEDNTASSDERPLLPPLPGSEAKPETPPTPLLDEALARAAALSETSAKVEEPSDEPETIVTPTPAPAPAPSPPVEPEPSKTAAKEEVPPREAEPAEVAARVKGSETRDERPKPIDPEKPAEPVKPRDVWKDDLAELTALVHEHLDREGGSSRPWSIRSLLLAGLARTQGEGSEKLEALQAAVLGVLFPNDPEQSTDRRSRSSQIRAAVAALEDSSPLEITELRLCRKVNGFGNFEPMNASCRAGQALIVYCELSGVRYVGGGESYRSLVSSRIDLIPQTGGDPVWSQSLGTAEDLCRRRRRDYYVNYRVNLPEKTAPGIYVLRLTQSDDLAGQSVSETLAITVQP